MNEKLLFFLKLCIGGAIAFLILNGCSFFYYNPPVSIAQENKTTNSKMIPNKFWVDMTEGCGYGTTDALGYNNAYDRNCLNPNVIVMGSSQIEGCQVSETANVVYLLNDAFVKDEITDNELKCLNIGVSGHDFKIQVSNFDYVLNQYTKADYVIFETSNLIFTEREFDNMLENTYHSDLGDRGILYTTLQRFPYARLMYLQLQHAMKNVNAEEEISDVNIDNEKEYSNYTNKLDELLTKLASSAQENGVKIIIMYHHNFNVEKDMTLTRTDKDRYYRLFKESCEKHDVEFVDVTDAFMTHFSDTYEFSYGFANTTFGIGHLNETGHKIISQELYKKLNELLEVG